MPSAGNGAPPSMAGAKGGWRENFAGLNPQRYKQIAANVDDRTVIAELDVPARHGKAIVVEQGHIVRISCPEGPQVADFIAFNRDDPVEKFWAARTRVIHGGHLAVGDRLWSCPPYSRPMLTLIADTVHHRVLPHGARSHDLLFCRCDAQLYRVVHGIEDHRNCNDNLAEAIADFGLPSSDVHDPFNIFMTTGLNEQGRPFYLPSEAKTGDYVELYADIACMVAVSACPGGSSGSQSNSLRLAVYAPSA